MALTACSSMDTPLDPSLPKAPTQLEYRTGSLIPMKKNARSTTDVKTISGEDAANTAGRAITPTDLRGK